MLISATSLKKKSETIQRVQSWVSCSESRAFASLSGFPKLASGELDKIPTLRHVPAVSLFQIKLKSAEWVEKPLIIKQRWCVLCDCSSDSREGRGRDGNFGTSWSCRMFPRFSCCSGTCFCSEVCVLLLPSAAWSPFLPAIPLAFCLGFSEVSRRWGSKQPNPNNCSGPNLKAFLGRECRSD